MIASSLLSVMPVCRSVVSSNGLRIGDCKLTPRRGPCDAAYGTVSLDAGSMNPCPINC